jgi:hypothetical protein
MALQIYSVPEISCEHCKDTLEECQGYRAPWSTFRPGP